MAARGPRESLSCAFRICCWKSQSCLFVSVPEVPAQRPLGIYRVLGKTLASGSRLLIFSKPTSRFDLRDAKMPPPSHSWGTGWPFQGIWLKTLVGASTTAQKSPFTTRGQTSNERFRAASSKSLCCFSSKLAAHPLYEDFSRM